MNNTINITVNGETKTFSKGISGLELSKYYKSSMLNDILAMNVNNHFMTLDTKIDRDCKIEFLDYMNRDSNRMYINGLKFLLIIAVKELLGNNSDISFEHSIDRGIYCKIKSDQIISEELFPKIEEKMKEIVSLDFQFETIGVTTKDLKDFYKSTNQFEKIKNINVTTEDYASLSKCKNYYAYFYGSLPISTGYLKEFALTYLGNNVLVLRFPVLRTNGKIPEYVHHEKIINVFEEYSKWIDVMKVSNVGSLNEIVSTGKINDFILMNEAIQNRNLMNIAIQIGKNNKNAKIILIAGPSSSGKTTTANKFCMYLRSLGVTPHLLSTDDYFLDRKETPKLPTGELDYESINTIDIKLFNEQLNKLINGDEVDIPRFNFIKGEKEFGVRKIKLSDNDVLVIEGLHTLNEKLTSGIPKENKVKIYISPFTPLSIDNYNHISTSDIRLLRRIIRDNRTRGHSVEDTLKMWDKVRAGEEIYVFPFQDEADYVFNTALIYEVGVLKIYVEPLLFKVENNSPYYGEARRLINFLKSFLPIPSDGVPMDSILREFIGKSCFYR